MSATLISRIVEFANRLTRSQSYKRRVRARSQSPEQLEVRQLLTADLSLIADSNSLAGGLENFTPIVEVNGTVFFVGDTVEHGKELWKTDGTAAGTVRLTDLNPGPNDSLDGSNVQMTDVNGTLFFVANDGIHGDELWKSDGTTEGTVMVRDINSGVVQSTPRHLENVNGTLFFSAYSDEAGFEVMKSDGTEAGTVALDLNVQPLQESFSSVADIANVNGQLFFIAEDASGSQLWKSDGTTTGTTKVTHFSKDEPHYPGEILGGDQGIYFTVYEATHGRELWVTDDSAIGARLFADITPGPFSTEIDDFAWIDNRLVLGFTTIGLWATDGTPEGSG